MFRFWAKQFNKSTINNYTRMNLTYYILHHGGIVLVKWSVICQLGKKLLSLKYLSHFNSCTVQLSMIWEGPTECVKPPKVVTGRITMTLQNIQHKNQNCIHNLGNPGTPLLSSHYHHILPHQCYTIFHSYINKQYKRICVP
jgi:hypothetical protein